MNEFNVTEVTNNCIQWIRNWFEENGKGCNAVIGISGGKDSTIVAGLCVKALGKERVIGVMMPNGTQKDISDARTICEFLDIKSYEINIADAVNGVLNQLKNNETPIDISRQTIINLPPRIRMSTLYAISQSCNGRVANTCNLSEDWVGYSTRYGDSAGDFSPLANLTVTEVKAVGKEIGLPINLVEKTPSDGLTNKTDEDNLGFTYAALDNYIRTGVCEDTEIKEKIDRLHKQNLFKLQTIPCFEP